MPDQVCIAFECLAPVTFEAPRGGKPKTVTAPLAVDVQIPMVDAGDAPVVFATRPTRYKHRRSHAPIERLYHDGGFWQGSNKDHFDFGDTPPTGVDALREIARHPDVTARFLSLDRVPWTGGAPKGDVPAGVRILEDGREAVSEAVRAGLRRNLLFVAGGLYRRVPCPSISVMDGRSGSWIIGVPNWLSDRTWGYAFAVDRLDELRAFLKANERPGGVKSVSCEFDGVTHQGLEVLAFDEGPANARYAIHCALYAVHEILPTIPEAPMLVLAELARIRDGLDAGTATAADADASLAKLDALRPAMGTTTHLMHAIRIGRDALARSLPEARPATARIHEDDLAALAGIA